MPITILNKEYFDVFGNSLPFYQSNAGDKVTVRYKILEQILVVSNSQNVLMLNFFENTVTWSSGNWFKEGFQVGDLIQFRKYDSLGNLLGTYNTDIVSIYGTNYTILKATDIGSAMQINMANGEILAVCLRTNLRSEEIVMTVNHTNSGTMGSEYSLIDGEATVFRFNIRDVGGFPNIPSGTYVPADEVGKHSGQFDIDAYIEFSNETPTQVGYQIGFGYVYYISFDVINSGVYNQTDFNYNNCLKLHNKFEYARLLGQPFNRNIFSLSDDANTGWFDEAYNVGVTDAVLVQGVSEIAFDAPTTFQVLVDCTMNPINQIAVGGCYRPQDEAYYKNKIPSQSTFAMMIPSEDVNSFFMQSPLNPQGARWAIEVINATQSGIQWVLDLKVTPNPEFTAFMNTREEGDRLFYFWVHVGSQNLLVFDGQLVSNPQLGGLIDMYQNIVIDHSENVTDTSGTASGYEANIEDDLAFIGKFRLDENQAYENMTARIEAHNTTSGDSFTLTSANFNFNSVPMVGGKYQLNLSQPINSILPNTSEKKSAFFNLYPSIDMAGKYGVEIYFPFIYRWEYWLQQLNASGDFYPDQNKDWYKYGNTGQWNLRIHLELVKDGEGFVFDDAIIIKDYDSDPNIYQEITITRDLDGSIVPVIIDGEMHTIVAEHTMLDGSAWDPATWGMITVEPTESSPRWLVSSVVPYDNNTQNPLSTANTLMDISYPSPNVARMKCKFDASKINLENGVKFTTKIKGCKVKAGMKLKSDNTPKWKSDGTIKLKSE